MKQEQEKIVKINSNTVHLYDKDHNIIEPINTVHLYDKDNHIKQ